MPLFVALAVIDRPVVVFVLMLPDRYRSLKGITERPKSIFVLYVLPVIVWPLTTCLIESKKRPVLPEPIAIRPLRVPILPTVVPSLRNCAIAPSVLRRFRIKGCTDAVPIIAAFAPAPLCNSAPAEPTALPDLPTNTRPALSMRMRSVPFT